MSAISVFLLQNKQSQLIWFDLLLATWWRAGTAWILIKCNLISRMNGTFWCAYCLLLEVFWETFSSIPWMKKWKCECFQTWKKHVDLELLCFSWYNTSIHLCSNSTIEWSHGNETYTCLKEVGLFYFNLPTIIILVRLCHVVL